MIDLRSDTVTTPTEEMRKAMAQAEVGDDVYGEDPTVNRLQDRAAEIFGKEAGLFVPSGTMGNQVAIKLHTQPGQEVVVEERAHIFNYEMATMAAFSGCLARPVPGERGLLSWEQIEAVLSPPVYYRARTGLITLENTHNMAGGRVLSAKATKDITDRAHLKGLPVHLDGARIFNAAAALGTSVRDLTEGCDSVMFCFSKGLSAPVGSMLLGTKEFIQEAWRVRKMFGGGMRQVGVLAAAALVALEQMPCRLYEDHENAKRLAEKLANIHGFRLTPEDVETNIVIAEVVGCTSTELVRRSRERGLLISAIGPHEVRFVTHKDVNRSDIDRAIQILATA
ncbi:MAG TPA: low specificity L-threonine aldolase [Acidobacteriota bacterium]|nr:low specificity L-threonine aldolase [Acidobacteriota bacterium]